MFKKVNDSDSKLSDIIKSPGVDFLKSIEVVKKKLYYSYAFDNPKFYLGPVIGSLDEPGIGQIDFHFVPNEVREDGKWLVKGIEVFATNTNEKANYLYIDNIKAQCGGKGEGKWLSFDFGPDGKLMDSFSMISEKYAIGISTIKVYIDPDLDVAGVHFPTYNDVGKSASFPFPASGKYCEDDVLALVALDKENKLVATARYDSSNDEYVMPELSSGHYYACYYTKSQRTNAAKREEENKKILESLTAEDGKHFVFQQVLKDAHLNWSYFSGNFAYVPLNGGKDDRNVERTWDNAIFGGVDVDAVYWKTTLENAGGATDVIPYAAYSPLRVAEAMASDDPRVGEYTDEIPEGYKRYNASGICLTGGDTLYLILEKNGVRSQPRKISYVEYNSQTGIKTPEQTSETGDPASRYYHLDGTPACASLQTPGILLLKVDPNGQATIILTR